MKSFYNGLIRFGNALQPLLLLAIRLAVGFGFYQSGLGKLTHIEQTAEFFANLHIPLPTVQAYLVGSIEFAGGVLLIAGFASRLAAALLTIVMLVAYLTAHHESLGELLTNPGALTEQAPFLFLYSVLIILAFGPGLLSLDAICKRLIFKQ